MSPPLPLGDLQYNKRGVGVSCSWPGSPGKFWQFCVVKPVVPRYRLQSCSHPVPLLPPGVSYLVDCGAELPFVMLNTITLFRSGDLEHIKVWVCEDDMLNDDPSTAVRRTQYSQHGWLPEYDCTAGECNWETDEAGARRLVSYPGLGSHANYPWETPLFVYLKVGKWVVMERQSGKRKASRWGRVRWGVT